MGEPSTPLFRLADLLLAEHGGVKAWVSARRAEGLSWRRVERDLLAATDGQVDVTHQTLCNWFPELVEAS